jgi:hypothetical protein
MSNNTTEQALIQIERNLEKLESARKQVLDVTKYSSQVNSIMVELVRKVEEVFESINLDSDSLNNSFENSQKRVDKHTDQVLANVSKTTSTFLGQFNELNLKFSESLDKSIEVNIEKSNELLKQQKETFKDYREIVEEFNAAIKTLKDSIENVDFETHLVPLENKLDSNFKDVNINLVKTFFELNNKLTQDLKDSLQKIFTQNDIFQSRLSNDLEPLKLKIDETNLALEVFSKQNLLLQKESNDKLMDLINNIRVENIAFNKKNVELLEALSNKKDNKTFLFVMTWLIFFFGLIFAVMIIKGFKL